MEYRAGFLPERAAGSSRSHRARSSRRRAHDKLQPLNRDELADRSRKCAAAYRSHTTPISCPHGILKRFCPAPNILAAGIVIVVTGARVPRRFAEIHQSIIVLTMRVRHLSQKKSTNQS